MSEVRGSESIAAEKQALRLQVRRRLLSLGDAQRESAADAMANRVLELPELQAGGAVMICLSFGLEIDTWKLVQRLLDAGREVYVPRAVSKSRRLCLHDYPCQLKTLSFGLKQPTKDSPALAAESIDSTIEAALLLGLGFDRQGFRLGYGGGFFDRFLRSRPFPAIGMGYDVQVFDRLPLQSHDLPMHRLVTESRVWTMSCESGGPGFGK